MPLLNESAREHIRTEKINTLVGELAAADTATVSAVIRSHRLNNKEIELLMELLQVNYILDIPDNEK